MADSEHTRIASAIPQSPSRRHIITAGAAAIGATAVAVPVALAGAVAGEDPIFAALAELERVNARVETVRQTHNAAEDLFLEMEPRTQWIYLSDGLSVVPDALDHEGIALLPPYLPDINRVRQIHVFVARGG